ncbi:MAG: T9SS type A sorting domain-containing protein [Rhodothermaceae bacterium]|nr:T9SS type A sorting domain-containing protein [Rhodothermaceae bacterium]
MTVYYGIVYRTCLICSLWILFTPVASAQTGTCEEAQAQALLEAGNVRARIYNDGPFFWKGGQNEYEVPKDEGVHALFASHFVIGGMIDGSLHMAASTYGPYEFWPGPLDENGLPPADCSLYDQIWEIHSEDFTQYDVDSTFSDNMLNWPWQLGAPVIDGDGDPSNYNLEGGDRPELLGNQSLWWIMNDRGNEHLWSETEPLGIEVHGTAYAFANAGIASDITFYRFRIFNKNTLPITDTYAGIFLDPDLGNASDDYIGSDSLLHLQYAYNGDPVDENGYEDTPPAIGYTFLRTPEAQQDALDNDHDGEIDEAGETTGMYAATFFDGGGGIQGDPGNGAEMHTYLRGLWINGEPITVGGTGLDFSNQVTRFVFPGDPAAQSYWTEIQPLPTNNSHPNPPADRRFITSSGPFTLLPGENTEFLLGVVWARGSNYLDSVRKLKNIVANMQASPDSYLTSGYRPELEGTITMPEPEHVLGFDQNFPNPFNYSTTLRYSLPRTMQVRLAVYDILGREVAVLAEGSLEAGVYTQEFNAAQLSPGIYYARIELDHLQFTKKLVRVP